MKYESSVIEDQALRLDNNEFIDCHLIRCRLIFSGTDPVTMTGCRITNCRWMFDGAAASTLIFLSALYHMGEQGKLAVEEILNNVKSINLAYPPKKVMFKCPSTNEAVFTGYQANEPTFFASSGPGVEFFCTSCGQKHTWNKENATLQ